MSTHTASVVAVPAGQTVTLDPGSGATLLVRNTGTVTVGCAVSDHERAALAQAHVSPATVTGGCLWMLNPGMSRNTLAPSQPDDDSGVAFNDTPAAWVPITITAPAGGPDGSVTVTDYAL